MRRMQTWSVLGLSLALGVGAIVGWSASAVGGTDAVVPTWNVIDHEPVLIYDITGYGFGGPIIFRMTVYRNGYASASSAPDFGQAGVSQFNYLEPEVVRQLQLDLAAAGAMTLPDFNGFTVDLPLTTVTVFGSPTQHGARSNTFSFFDSFDNPAYGEVVTLINEFFTQAFPAYPAQPGGPGEK